MRGLFAGGAGGGRTGCGGGGPGGRVGAFRHHAFFWIGGIFLYLRAL